ncbi:MAG: AAA family ATPase [Syntrophales bacterium]
MGKFLKPIFANIPEELTKLNQWVLFRAEIRDGKETKPLHKPGGEYAKSNNSSTWSTFDAVKKALDRFDGIGFVLTKDDPFVGIDFDKCYCPAFEIIDPTVKQHIKSINTYTEISPSGKGIRALLRGNLPVDGRKNGRVEIYQSKRYVTITGHRLPGYPATIEARQAELETFYKTAFPERSEDAKQTPDNARQVSQSLTCDWKGRLQAGFGSKSGDKIKKLYDGDWSDHPSQSEGDMALCAHLAYYLSGDFLAIDQAFRRSGLFRSKWDERRGGQTYGQMTIDKAIQGCTEFYQESIKSPAHTQKNPTRLLTEEDQSHIESVRPYDPPKIYTLEDAILESRDFHKIELPEKQSLIHPIIREQQIILLSGWRGVGKTWAGLGIADAVTRGESFGPWKTEKTVPCFYLDGEMAAQDPRERLNLLNPNKERKAFFYIYSDAYANILGLPRANLMSERWRTEMKRILRARKVKLWIIDNIASLAGGIDENSKKDWDPINSWLLELRFAGITSILLHHVNKEGGQRGTSAREDNIDSSIILKHPPDYKSEDGADFIMSHTKSRVSHPDLSLIQDVRFKLRQTESGHLEWTWQYIKAEIRSSVLDMLNDRIPGNEIADQLGISKGYVSRIKKGAIEKGIITRQGRYKE